MFNSDLLIAAWDGLPPKGMGGTAEAVGLAVNLQKEWIHLNVRDLSKKAYLIKTLLQKSLCV